MNYIEVNITINPLEPWHDLISSDLGGFNYESFIQTENGIQAFIKVEEYSENDLSLLLNEYSENCETNFKIKEIESINWNEEWEKNFSPIVVANKCIVRATFHNLDRKYDYDIVINPKMSFGTGHHATTHLMIEQMLKLDIQNQSILDMGCGTSVLAILASKKAAKVVFAVDYDEWSVNNSIENIKLNNVDNVEVKQGSEEQIKGGHFNLILANINLNVLLAQIETYYQVLEPKGSILFSGLLEKDLNKLLAKTKQLGLVVKETKQKDKWIMVHCEK